MTRLTSPGNLRMTELENERLHWPERHAKAIGIIIIQPEEEAQFAALTDAQKGYFLHWCWSNWHDDNAWSRGMRKARAQR